MGNVLALRQTGDLSRVYPSSLPKTPGMGSSVPGDPEKDKWMDVFFVWFFCFLFFFNLLFIEYIGNL